MMTDAPKIRFVSQGGEQFSAAFRALNQQPNWVIKAAVLVFLVVVGIPILLLLLLAAILATVVFAVLAGVNRILALLKGIGRPGGSEGRRNVRVIQPDSPRRKR